MNETLAFRSSVECGHLSLTQIHFHARVGRAWSEAVGREWARSSREGVTERRSQTDEVTLSETGSDLVTPGQRQKERQGGVENDTGPHWTIARKPNWWPRPSVIRFVRDLYRRSHKRETSDTCSFFEECEKVVCQKRRVKLTLVYWRVWKVALSKETSETYSRFSRTCKVVCQKRRVQLTWRVWKVVLPKKNEKRALYTAVVIVEGVI